MVKRKQIQKQRSDGFLEKGRQINSYTEYLYTEFKKLDKSQDRQ